MSATSEARVGLEHALEAARHALGAAGLSVRCAGSRLAAAGALLEGVPTTTHELGSGVCLEQTGGGPPTASVLGDLLGAALGTLLAEQRRCDVLGRALALQQAVGLHGSVQAVADATVAAAADLLADAHVAVVLVDGDHAATVARDGAVALAGAEELAVLAVQTGTRVLSADADAVAAVPFAGGRAGALVAGGPVVPDEADLDLLTLLAQHAGWALAAVEERTRAEQSRLELLGLLASSSHDVKTPLTVVLGTLRLLQQHDHALTEGERRELLATASRRTRDVSRLVDGVFATLRSGLGRVQTRVAVAKVVSEAVAGLEHGRRVDVGELPATQVAADAVTLRCALGSMIEEVASLGDRVAIDGALAEGTVTLVVRNGPHELDDLRGEPDFAPVDDILSGAPGVSPLFLAARLADAFGARISGGSAGDHVAYTLSVAVAS